LLSGNRPAGRSAICLCLFLCESGGESFAAGRFEGQAQYRTGLPCEAPASVVGLVAQVVPASRQACREDRRFPASWLPEASI